MTTQLLSISPSLLIDIEEAYISHSEGASQLSKDSNLFQRVNVVEQ